VYFANIEDCDINNIILLVILYGSEKWLLLQGEKMKFQASGNKVFKKISGCNKIR
jgi:hypothetical protein